VYVYDDNLAIMHVDRDRQAVEEGVLSKGNHKLIQSPEMETKAQHYKNGVSNLPPQQQVS